MRVQMLALIIQFGVAYAVSVFAMDFLGAKRTI